MISCPRSLRPSIFVCLGLLILSAAAMAQEPLIIGEHLPVTIESSHPYPAGNADSPSPVWSDRYSFPGAEYLVFQFKQFELAPGDRVEIRDPERK